VDGAIEVVRGLVAFELAFASGLLCLGKKSGGLSGGQRLEISRDIESLLQVGRDSQPVMTTLVGKLMA